MTVGYVGAALHLILLAWIAPIAFFDAGIPALDWRETLVPFAAITLPLFIAMIGRSQRAFRIAGYVALGVATLMFYGPGLFLLIPALCYITAVRPPDTTCTGH